MNKDSKKERLLELLADEVLLELSESETNELKRLKKEFPEIGNDYSFEEAALAISLSDLDTNQELPHNLQAKVLRDADEFFDEAVNSAKRKSDSSLANNFASKLHKTAGQNGQTADTKTPFWQWLTPIFAGIGCIALLANIWITYNRNQSVVDNKKPDETIDKSKELTPSVKRQQFLATAKNVIKTTWSSPDENNKELKGEIVWSDEKQEGYMTFIGLPKNDIDKETYQLWIFRDKKLEPHPIDGGVFDVNKDGEVIIPIDAKLKVKNPKVFAVTVEKPGGVPVSNRKKIAALAKVTT